jgi:hypothetical protein
MYCSVKQVLEKMMTLEQTDPRLFDEAISDCWFRIRSECPANERSFGERWYAHDIADKAAHLLGITVDKCEAAVLDILSVKHQIVDEVFSDYLGRLHRGPERPAKRPGNTAVPTIIVMPATERHPAMTRGLA